MCNIAGYVGSKQAAPILVEMLKKQEGLAGGYYTGIVTYHEGTFYSYKLTGDTQKLLDTYDILSMPGSIGIIHSRSKAGGGDEWAHPFIGRDPEGNVLNYYVANGSVGYFAGREAENNALSQALEDEGYRYDSRVQIESERYPTLRDGSKVHMSDVAAQLIARNMHRGMTGAAAMEKCFCDMPCELVGLMLMAHTPSAIAYCATNMPMTAGRAEHGMYLASAALAMPEDARYVQQLPVHASGYVYADRYEMIPFKTPVAPLAEMDASALSKAYAIIEDELKAGEKSYSELRKAVKPIFGDAFAPTTRTVYEVLYALKKEGRITMYNKPVEGAFPHLTAPKTIWKLIE
ncbi:MAG: hypothetical protein IKW00_02315 [Clostridia bacterium]|nr:hypothetical protein [Clostridia bacterium]